MKTNQIWRWTAICGAMTISNVALASTQVEQICIQETIGQTCDCDSSGACNCQLIYGPVCFDITVEVGPITPTPVYRFFDGHHHLYSTTNNPPAGYVGEGVKFHLANDSAVGGVTFGGLPAGQQGWMFPDSDTTAEQENSGLVELYLFHNVGTGDNLYTLDPNDPDLLNYHGSANCTNPPTCTNIFVDEYFGGQLAMRVGQ